MKQIFSLLLTIFTIFSCKKDNASKCYPETGKGRIIGFNPCGYYKDSDKVMGAGFVIEIDKGTTKDTVATYQIPDGLFEFPEINFGGAVMGSYLFPLELQNSFKIRFSYRLADENEKTFIACPTIVNIADYYAAVRNREIFVSCISKQ